MLGNLGSPPNYYWQIWSVLVKITAEAWDTQEPEQIWTIRIQTPGFINHIAIFPYLKRSKPFFLKNRPITDNILPITCTNWTTSVYKCKVTNIKTTIPLCSSLSKHPGTCFEYLLNLAGLAECFSRSQLQFQQCLQIPQASTHFAQVAIHSLVPMVGFVPHAPG